MSPAVVTGLLFMMVLMFKTDSADGQCSLMSVESCGSGWYQLDDRRCMMISSTRATFDDAEILCQNEGGHLVSLKKAMDFFRLICLSHKQNIDTESWLWIGARRQEGVFQWTDGSGRAYYLYRDGPGQDCGEMKIGMFWRTTMCSEKRQFVCQKPV